MLTDIAVAFVLAALSGMGVGSAGLLVVYLTGVAGLSQLEAQFANLCFFILSSATSLALLAKRRLVKWRLIIPMSITGILGSIAGSLLAPVLAPGLLRRLFAAMLLISGLPSLIKSFRELFRHKKD